MKRFVICFIILVFTLGVAFFAHAEKYPTKSVRVIIHSAAGGGSDTWARKVSALMEKDLGVKMVCTNKPGGKGGIAANFVWNSKHDGYTILGASETSMTYGVNGACEKTAKFWNFYISGGSPGVIAVLKDSPFETFEDLVKATRANPDTVKVSNAGIGKLWHLKSEMFKKYANIPIKHSPYNGSAPAIVALMSKEVDAVSCSAGEAGSYVESGKFRPLVMTEKDPFNFPGYGETPPITKFFPELNKYLPMSQFLCLMVPKDTPKEILNRLGAAFEYAMQTPEMAEFMKKQNAVRYGLWGEPANKLAIDMEKKFSWYALELGITKVHPEKLGIEKP
jgi:tripartite-type tricarboxylate transporter receptor subunit TctC